MRKVNRRRWLLGLAQLALAGCFCSGVAAQLTRPTKVLIGGIYGLSGPLADMSADVRDAALLALEDRNKAGGRRVELLVEDSRWDAKQGVAAFYKLVNIDKVAVLHVLGSAVTLAMKPLSERQGVLLFSAAAHSEITTGSKLVLRHANSAQNDGRLLAEAVQIISPRKIAMAVLQDEWSEAFAQGFSARAAELLPQAQIVRAAHFRDDTDFRTSLSRLAAGKPDVFVLSSWGMLVGTLLKQLKDVGYRGEIYVNNGLILSAEAQKYVRREKLCGFHYQDYRDLPLEFRRKFERRFGRTPCSFSLSSYTDFELIHHAVQQAGESPAALSAFVRSLERFAGSYETVAVSRNGDMTTDLVVKEWGCNGAAAPLRD